MTLLCSFSGTVAGPTSLWNLFCFKGWDKELHTVGLQHGFPGPKPGACTACAPELFTDTFLGWCGHSPRVFSQHCWKNSSRTEVTPSPGAEFLSAVPGAILCLCMGGWIHFCSELLLTLQHQPGNQAGPSGVDSSSRAKFSQWKWISVSAAGICPWKSVSCNS